MNASVLWDVVSRAKIECHEAAGPRTISFLRADCIFAFYFFSSHLEITLLFCLRYFTIVRMPLRCNVLESFTARFRLLLRVEDTEFAKQ